MLILAIGDVIGRPGRRAVRDLVPGLRKEYSPDYYAAFIFDPDGNNIEAVCFD